MYAFCSLLFRALLVTASMVGMTVVWEERFYPFPFCLQFTVSDSQHGRHDNCLGGEVLHFLVPFVYSSLLVTASMVGMTVAWEEGFYPFCSLLFTVHC